MGYLPRTDQDEIAVEANGMVTKGRYVTAP